MTARIYRPAKTAMQSGKSNARMWVLDYEPANSRWVEPLMGYTSSGDMLSQVRLQFESKEEAIRYAERNEIEFRVIEPKETQRRAVSYSDNFRYDRQTPWTH